MKNSTKKIAFLGLCTAVALVLAYVEHLLPPLFSAVPGIKIGLPNIVIIFVLYRCGWREAVGVSLVRMIVVSFLFGNLMALIYSISGACFSMLVMILLKRMNFLSIVGVSVAGAVFHNVGQILAAMVLLGTAELGYYLIVLAVTGTISGIFVGLCGAIMVKRISKRVMGCLLLGALVLQSTCFGGCKKADSKYSAHSFEYFDTVTSILGYANSRKEFDAVTEEVWKELEKYHQLFTIYERYEGLENLCTINEVVDGAHRTVMVDESIIDMLLYAKEMYALTNGKVNIALGSVLSIWHEYREAGMNDPEAAQVPPMEQLIEASKHTDINQVVIDEEACTVTLTDPAMKLDVGAIAKGYATEMVARSLEEKGISGYVINVGGNVRTIGLKGDGKKWVVGIENPEEKEEEAYFAYLELAGESLVTSGSYQRYYTVDGKRYHHIIEPETLLPAEGYSSVSVVCKNSGNGDALSTALFCMSLEEGITLVEELPDTEAMWVLNDGTCHMSSGFDKYKRGEQV
ncbi:MAG: Gx transporter family protein [Lachnospiraceae bacterium]|nr:Gx transporter family protein [Lachnospiraceae bacterium]